MYISEGYILPYWKELLTQQILSLFIKKKSLSNKDQDIFLLMSETNKKNLKVITNVVNWRFTS